VEFLRDEDGSLYFMEMNTRLQVEHPVTEMVTGTDIVREQLRIAANMPLSFRQEDVSFSGHAIEVRVNAEDPDAGFSPTPGEVTVFEPPEIGPDLRIDTHVRQGYVVPPYYDSMIAKLICHGPDRLAAIARVKEALSVFNIEGVKSTIPIHQRILEDERFVSGDYDTRLVGWMLAEQGGEAHG